MAIEIRLRSSGYNLEINAKTRALYYAQGMTIYQSFRRYLMVSSSPALVLPSNLNDIEAYVYIYRSCITHSYGDIVITM